MKRLSTLFILACAAATVVFSGCETTSSVTVKESPARVVEKTDSAYEGLKRKVAVARFSNETQYAKGAFYDKDNDPMQHQVMDILTTKLAVSGKFILIERSDLELVEKEQDYSGLSSAKIGADYLLVGSITKYGRKNVGTHASVFSRSKTQIVEAGVSIRLIDVSTGEIIYADEGEGEAEITATDVLGFGTSAGYDSTLNDKAIEAAIQSLVGNIEKNCTDRPWKTYIISDEDGVLLVAGGKSQGIKAGNLFTLCEAGKTVENKQTGMLITLPGKEVGTLRVMKTLGSGANEYSMVELISGSISGDITGYEVFERAE